MDSCAKHQRLEHTEASWVSQWKKYFNTKITKKKILLFTKVL